MKAIPPRYVRHIGKARAKPELCPVCGTATTYALPALTMDALLKAIYCHPNRVFSREVPGWKGFVTWFFECEHVNPIAFQMTQENPFLSLIPKATWDGKFIPIPFSFEVTA